MHLGGGTVSGGGDGGAGSATVSGIENAVGGAFDDLIAGSAARNFLYSGSGNDSLRGESGADTLEGASGNDELAGEGGNDRLFGGAGNDHLYGGDISTDADANGNDQLFGEAGNDFLKGGLGADRLNGGAGNDTLLGGPPTDFGDDGVDTFVFAATPGSANADVIESFEFDAGADSNDKLGFVASFHSNIGAAGDFAVNDPRFHAGAGATSGHDLSDRVILDTSTGKLYYDADGSASGASQLVATFNGIPDLQATDISVI